MNMAVKPFLVFSILSLTSAVRGHTFSISSCMDKKPQINAGETCKYSCAVNNMTSGDTFEVVKQQVTVYRILESWTHDRIVVIYNSVSKLSPSLPDKYSERSNSNSVEITISGAKTEDIGKLVCEVKDSNGATVAQSVSTEIKIVGPRVRLHWDTSEVHGDNRKVHTQEELTMHPDDIDKLVWHVTVTDPLAVKPTAAIVVEYPHSEEDITHLSTIRGGFTSVGEINDAGMMVNVEFNSLASDIPKNAISLTKGKPTLTGKFAFPGKSHQAHLTLNLLFPPIFENCVTYNDTDFQKVVEVTCDVFANPGVSSFTLKQPGRTGSIENVNPPEGYSFLFNKTGVDWSYQLTVTYPLTMETFGLNEIIARSSKGTTTHSYTIHNIPGFAELQGNSESQMANTWLVVGLLLTCHLFNPI